MGGCIFRLWNTQYMIHLLIKFTMARVPSGSISAIPIPNPSSSGLFLLDLNQTIRPNQTQISSTGSGQVGQVYGSTCTHVHPYTQLVFIFRICIFRLLTNPDIRDDINIQNGIEITRSRTGNTKWVETEMAKIYMYILSL